MYHGQFFIKSLFLLFWLIADKFTINEQFYKEPHQKSCRELVEDSCNCVSISSNIIFKSFFQGHAVCTCNYHSNNTANLMLTSEISFVRGWGGGLQFSPSCTSFWNFPCLLLTNFRFLPVIYHKQVQEDLYCFTGKYTCHL